MDILELMKKRYSVRTYLEKSVEEEKINKIIEAGIVAPTACNNQPFRIYVIKSKDGLEKIHKCIFRHNYFPLAILVTYKEDEAWNREFDDKSSGEVDASIVTTHMMLEASNLGLGSCWIMHFIPEAVKEEFKLEEEIPCALLTIGYPKEDSVPSQMHFNKKDKKEIVREV